MELYSNLFVQQNPISADEHVVIGVGTGVWGGGLK